MPKTVYVPKTFPQEKMQLIDTINEICETYAAQGFDLTLRQVYYQLVSRNLIPNEERSYNRIGDLVNDARLAGLIDWEYIVDRTRRVRRASCWDHPGEILDTCGRQFRLPRWEGQKKRVEVYIEKDALVGIFEGVCEELDVPLLSCRGYTSASEMWSSGMRIKGYLDAGLTPVILHFGDHDPSGLDMTRDIRERIALFAEETVTVVRVALIMEQIREFNPPPNPVKLTDGRHKQYTRLTGQTSSWELDALRPEVLVRLVREHVAIHLDRRKFDERLALEQQHRRLLNTMSERWKEIDRWAYENPAESREEEDE